MVTELMAQVGEHAKTITSKDREILYRQTKIDQLTHEMAVLKRWKFGRSCEQLDQAQASLLDETIDAEIAAIEQELKSLTPTSRLDTDTHKQPKRAALPPELPRVEHLHEPDSTVCNTSGCGCSLKRIGEDVSEKLDYTPGLFTWRTRVSVTILGCEGLRSKKPGIKYELGVLDHQCDGRVIPVRRID